VILVLLGRCETLRRIVCTLLLTALASAACTQRKSVTLDQMSLLGPERVWVTDHDQSVVLLYEPKLVRDTLVGYVGRHKEKLPSSGVREVRVQTAAPTRTAALVVGLAAGLAGFLVLAGGTGGSAVIASTTGPADTCDIDPDQTICPGVAE
jgi:hypothetical protein